MSSLVVPMIPSRTIAHGIPRPPEKSVLLVFLTEDPSNQNNILNHVRPWLDGVEIKPWRPSNHTLQSLAAQGNHRDSMANLYGLAMVCHRAGWSQFLVADELTSRQISRDLRCAESADVSLVMMSVLRLREEEYRPGQFRVIARRTTEPGSLVDLYRKLQTFDIRPNFVGNEEYREVDVYGKFGLHLHDPYRQVFAPNDGYSLAREDFLRELDHLLSLQKGLPAELVADIVSRADADGAKHYPIPSGIPTSRSDWNMFLLRPTTEKERAILQSALHDTVIIPTLSMPDSIKDKRSICLHIVPWEEDHPASRLDISRLNKAWQPVAGQFVLEQWLIDLPRPGDTGTVKLFKIEVDEGRFPRIYRKPMEVTIPELFGSSDDQSDTTPRLAALASHAYQSEILYDPARPFYPYPPPFLPVDPRMNSVAVFCLAANISLEERRMIEDSICTEADGDNPENPAKVCCIVPWERQDADGSLDDIWDIFWTMTRLEERNHDRAYEYYYPPPYFFVDRQSLVDKTIIAVDKYEYCPREGDDSGVELLKDVVDPRIRGFLYGRIAPEETHLVRDNRTSGNMFFDEFFDEPEDVKKYLRRDWPGHGILHDEYSDEEGEAGQE